MNTRIFSLFLVLAIVATVALAHKPPTVQQRYKVTLANQNCKNRHEKPLELICNRATRNDRNINFNRNVFESKVVNNKNVVNSVLVQKEDIATLAVTATANRNH